MVPLNVFISQNQVSHNCITVVWMFWCIGNGAGLSYIPNLFDRFSGLRSKRALASDSLSMLFLKWSLLHSELFTLAILASSSESTKSKSIFWKARTIQKWKIRNTIVIATIYHWWFKYYCHQIWKHIWCQGRNMKFFIKHCHVFQPESKSMEHFLVSFARCHIIGLF